MELIETSLPDVKLVRARVFRDARGTFREVWRQGGYAELGLPSDFVQDNISVSGKGVLRGLHFQHPNGQGKLVSAVRGAVWDVAVDIRVGSPTFGRWFGSELSAENGLQMYIPAGFAHGFVALEDDAVVGYKCTEYYDAAADHTLLWNDPEVAVEWPCPSPILSEKDAHGLTLEALRPGLPRYEPGRQFDPSSPMRSG